MSVSIVEEDGLITIPEDVRDLLQLVPGSQVEFVKGPNGVDQLIKVVDPGQAATA